MAIDFTSFTKLSIPDLLRKLYCFHGRNSHVFPVHYTLYDARSLDRFDKEISNDMALIKNHTLWSLLTARL